MQECTTKICSSPTTELQRTPLTHIVSRYPMVCWLPRYRLPNSVYIARGDLGPEHRTQRPPLTPSFSESLEAIEQPKTPLLSSPYRSQDAQFEFFDDHTPRWTPTVLYKQPGRTKAASGPKPMRSTTRVRRIVPPQPLLPSRNPPPMRLEDYVPWFA